MMIWKILNLSRQHALEKVVAEQTITEEIGVTHESNQSSQQKPGREMGLSRKDL
jgi:hypothetical protein